LEEYEEEKNANFSFCVHNNTTIHTCIKKKATEYNNKKAIEYIFFFSLSRSVLPFVSLSSKVLFLTTKKKRRETNQYIHKKALSLCNE
jgi:hypothetical protein